MDNLIIISGHRVGSRWIHYLLADLYNKEVSPEIDRNKLYYWRNKIRGYLDENKIPKFHRCTVDNVLEKVLPVDYKVLAIVRNPRDRAVSYAFHHRYHDKNKGYQQRKEETDFDAIKYTILEDVNFKNEELQHQDNMLFGYSTRNKIKSELPYIWTTYEWLVEDTEREIKAISNFLNAGIADRKIRYIIHQHSFKTKSGREVGTEKRNDLWRRKGIIGDYMDWFDEEMMDGTKEWNDIYWEKVNAEIRG